MNKARTNPAHFAVGIVALATLVPTLAAGAGESVGELSVNGSPGFFGGLKVSSADAAVLLDGAPEPLRWGELAGGAETLHARHVVVHRNGTHSQQVLGVGVGELNPVSRAQVQYANTTQAQIQFVPGTSAYEIVAVVERARPGTLAIRLESAEIPGLGHLVHDVVFERGLESEAWNFFHRVPHGSMALSRHDPNLTDTLGPLGASIRLELIDDGRLYLMGGTVRIQSADGWTSWETGLSERAVVHGANVVVERTLSFAVLELGGAHIETSLGDEAFRFFATEADVDLQGEMTFQSATGSLRDAGGEHLLASDAGTIEGSFVARLAMTHGPELPMATHRYPVSTNDDGVETKAGLSGEFRLASLNGEPLALPGDHGGVTVQGVAAGAGIGLGLVALAWGLQKAFVALGGFARPSSPHPALDNALRNRLHGLVLSYPGIHSRRLQGLVGVSSGTFFHHIRVLLASDLISRRRIGSSVVYVPSARAGFVGGVAAPELRVRSAMTADVRRRIAVALADGPRTQRELSAAVGVPQQNVSFHLKALLDRGAVTAGPTRPHVYQLRHEYAGLVHELSAPGP